MEKTLDEKAKERIKDLDDHGNSPISIVKYLINASLNRKLEISEIQYSLGVLSKLPVIPAELEEKQCEPCRNMDDLIYRLLQLPSQNEIDDFKRYLANDKYCACKGKVIPPMPTIVQDTYEFIIGKLDADES